jgi:anaerobic magnesium-protoporphyrin IX monomethyl ester cyclase
MKFLLIGINSKYSHSNPALYYIKEILKSKYEKIEVKEFTIKTQIFEILDYITEFRPDVVMLSCYIWNIELMKYLFTDIKAINSNIKLIIGGPEVAFNADFYQANYHDVDIIMTGNGVEATRILIDHDFNIPCGIVDGGDEANAFVPFSKEYFGKTISAGRIPYYEASRGCPFKCSYCLSSNKSQNMYYKSIEDIREELRFIIELKPKLVKFVDRSFNINRKISHEILDLFARLDSNTCFHLEIHPAYLNEEDFDKLSKLPKDRIQIEIGIQSTDPKVLTTINRTESIDKILKNTKRLVEINKFHQHTDMIIGLPNQDMKSAISSFNEIHGLGADHFQLGFLKVLFGTEIERRKEEFEMRFSSKPPYQIMKTKWLTYEQIGYWRQIEEILSSFANSEQFDYTIAYLLSLKHEPYEVYSEIVDYWIENGLDFSNHKWNYLAQHILEYMKFKYEEKERIVIDYLRMDWAKLASSHFFPEFLSSEETKKMKTDYYLRIKESAFYKSKIKLHNLKKAVFVIPKSNYVKSKLCDDVVGYIFYKENRTSFHKIEILSSQLDDPDKLPKQ